VILHAQNECVDPSLEASMVLLSFQEASLSDSPDSYSSFGELPFILDTYSQGCCLLYDSYFLI
jgi:hypothetical protein